MSDHFCGCGGSGWGAKKALDKVGGEILYGANHWKLATESYSASKISRDVDCTDISACDPRRFPSTDGSTWSPECTTHSPAGGNTHKQLRKQMDLFNKQVIDPATERSRATMWDVCALKKTAKCEKYYSKKQNGLKQDWSKDICWMNPPYGRSISEWVKKAYDESRRGATVVCLLPARTDTNWWWDYCLKGQIEFIKGRKNLKRSGYDNFFDTREEAKQYLIEKATKEVEHYKSYLQQARSKLGQVESL